MISKFFGLYLLFVQNIFTQPDDINHLNQTLQDVCPLESVLSVSGLEISDLGYRPQNYWMSFPHPERIPLTLPVFSDLFSNPVYLYPYVRQAAKEFMSYSLSSDNQEKFDKICQLSHHLGINRIFTGFRSYGGLIETFPGADDFDILFIDALDRVQESAIKCGKLDPVGESNLHWQKDRELWIECLENAPDSTKYFYAVLLFNIAEIEDLVFSSLRKVPQKDIDFCLTITDYDDQAFLRAREDIIENIDFTDMWAASLKLSELADFLTFKISKNVQRPDSSLTLSTPFGAILVGSENEDQWEFENDVVITLIDFGGDDLYSYSSEANIHNPVFLLVDLSGDDIHRARGSFKPAGSFVGISLAVDLSGNDLYYADQKGLGWSDIGFGALFDFSGEDIYQCDTKGLGASYTGVGLLLDFSGDDRYTTQQEAIGYGAFGGIGVLGDLRGNDLYYAEPWAVKTSLEGDYHSGGIILGNLAMGAGWGRRADMGDGHNYGGGLGMLIDISGDDDYSSGNWSQGVGYWLGMGFIYDGSGDDNYNSCYFSTASAAHFAIGAIIDEAGDDSFVMWGNSPEIAGWGWAGAGLSFGWDFAVTLLFNSGGNDYYEAKKISLGCSQIRSNSYFIDTGGDDFYKFPEEDLGMGNSDQRDYYDRQFYCFSKSIGLFLDCGGDDEYVNWNLEKDRCSASTLWKNNSSWHEPENSYLECHGIGADLEWKNISY